MNNTNHSIYINDMVSIIMPAYNCEKYISEAIQSVQNQVYKKWELIIVDDNSTDNTRKIIEEYLKLDKKNYSIL